MLGEDQLFLRRFNQHGLWIKQIKLLVGLFFFQFCVEYPIDSNAPNSLNGLKVKRNCQQCSNTISTAMLGYRPVIALTATQLIGELCVLRYVFVWRDHDSGNHLNYEKHGYFARMFNPRMSIPCSWAHSRSSVTDKTRFLILTSALVSDILSQVLANHWGYWVVLQCVGGCTICFVVQACKS